MNYRIVKCLGMTIDPTRSHEVRRTSEGKVYIYNNAKKTDYCSHYHDKDELLEYLKNKSIHDPLCPKYKGNSLPLSISVKVRHLRYECELTPIFFKALNSPPNWTAEARLHATMYGDYTVEENLKWVSDYSKLKIFQEFTHEEGVSSQFHMAYDIWRPKESSPQLFSPLFETKKELSIIILTNGVPVNRREWYAVARLLSRFYIVVTVDLFGMGDSSKPLAFKSEKGIWHWSWKLHAKIFQLMISSLFPEKKVFFCANDWGAGAVQSFIGKHGDMLKGASINSAIALNGYWVQHIGSLSALAALTYPSETFTVEAIRFIGTFTSLLETMFHRTPKIHNQYTMAPLQDPYVDVSAYWNVNKNPANTEYKAHAVRVLAEQASYILGNGELLPYDPVENENGLKFTKWNTDILAMWGDKDKMMPVGQLHRFANIISTINDFREMKGIPSNLKFRYKVLPKAGHFAISDQPEIAADTIIDWIRSIEGSKTMQRSFFGFTEIARQDEKHVMSAFDELGNL